MKRLVGATMLVAALLVSASVMPAAAHPAGEYYPKKWGAVSSAVLLHDQRSGRRVAFPDQGRGGGLEQPGPADAVW